ncbi:MAG: DUF4251 domain-containing protein [Bacteroidales bacterium]|nr:DUF4251 domain-containing protein [Bacteroidales bacterium]
MKVKKISVVVFLFSLLILPFQLRAQSENELSFKDILNSKQYIIEVRSAYPQSGRHINLTSTYSLIIKNDTIDSYLPYFGRAYSVPYGGGEGLIFQSQIKKYTVEKEKEDEIKIKIETVTPEDSYTYFISVYDNLSADISVHMNKRNSIRYQGSLEALSKQSNL